MCLTIGVQFKSCLAVDGVSDRPEVYKTLMVRIRDKLETIASKRRRIPDGTGLYREGVERLSDTNSVATVDE